MYELKAAVRETLRTTAIALIPVVVVQVESGVLDLRLITIALVIGLLRGVEKYLYKMDVKTGLEFKMID